MNHRLNIIECPRDAMQGWPRQIGTQEKINYLTQLLKAGFHTLDCVSFVSAKAIPQMADSAEVLAGLDLTETQTKLLAIVANVQGAKAAVGFQQVTYLGFPFSISETFQKLNTNSTIAQSWERVKEINQLCRDHGKLLVVYISMGFGNPYGDPYHAGVIAEWVQKMQEQGIGTVSLADTVGLASREMVHTITQNIIGAFPSMEIGVHLHSTPAGFVDKMEAALEAGCKRFDGALKGIGGCPMAQNTLVGNMDTCSMVDYLEAKGITTGINRAELEKAVLMAGQIFI